MNHALLIAARDVREKSRLFLISLVLACMPFLATLLPSSHGRHQDVIAAMGGFLALVVGLGLAAGLGITTFGRDLSEKRLSFWYAKPISPAALWIGKAAGGLFSAFVCFSIIAIPASLAAGRMWEIHWVSEQWQLPVALVAGMIVLFLLGHTASTMLRSRSALLGIDLVAAIIATTLLAWIIRPLLFTNILIVFVIALAVALVVVLAVAPYWQLANGRSDLRRSHAALSRAIWSGVAIVLALAGAIVLWLLSARPSNYDRINALYQSPTGNAVFVTGSAPLRRGLNATFAMNPANGESERIGLPMYWNLAFSRDGRYAAWVEPGFSFWSRGAIVVRDLQNGTNATLNIEASLVAQIVFSDDSSRFAVRDGSTLSIVDRADGRLLASMSTTPNPRHSFWFVTPDVLRIVAQRAGGHEPTPVEITEFDVRTKQRRVVGATEAMPGYNYVAVSGDGTRMLLRGDRRIVDARTGAAIATLPAAEGNRFAVSMLNDGRVATIERSNDVTNLTLYSRDGALEHKIALAERAAWIVGERTDGKLLLLAFSKPNDDFTGRGRTMIVVDVNRGVVDRTLPDTKGPAPQWSPDPRLVRYDANAKLAAVDANGKIKYWN